MTGRRASTILTLVIAWPLSLLAQAPSKIPRIGFLSSRARPDNLESDYHIGFVRGLRELGYEDGRNVKIEWRYAGGDYDRLPALAAELVHLPVDVLVTDGTPSTLAARKATSTIPIVFGSAGDPIGSGLVKSLGHPGRNVTGVALLSSEMSAKQMEMLVRLVPRLRLLGIVFNPGNESSPLLLKQAQAAAGVLKIRTLMLAVGDDRELEHAFALMALDKAEAFIYLPDSRLYQFRGRMAELSVANRLPGMGAGAPYADAGGLMSYGANLEDNYHRAAAFVIKILNGAHPADLPVEQPTKFEVVINLKTAKALGLSIPPDLLVLADRVIE